MASKLMTLQVRSHSSDSLPERSKGVDSSSISVNCVGSNPTAVILSLAFCDVLHVYAFNFLILRSHAHRSLEELFHCFPSLEACFQAASLASRPASQPASRLPRSLPRGLPRGLPQGLPRGVFSGLLRGFEACLKACLEACLQACFRPASKSFRPRCGLKFFPTSSTS